jgi:RIO-like serine/threonine protein kinase
VENEYFVGSRETAVLAIFRRFRVGPYQMLFLNSNTDAQLRTPISHLIKSGLVEREKRPHAYHLTTAGYDAMCNACAPRKAHAGRVPVRAR